MVAKLSDAIAKLIADPIRAAMCAPLWLAAKPGDAGTVLGFVYLDSHTRDPFTESDLQVLTVLVLLSPTFWRG